MLAFDSLLQRWMRQAAGGSAEIQTLLSAMLRGDVERFEDGLQTLMVQALSFQDLGGRAPERVYHTFTLGLLVNLRSTHKVVSNQDSGLGRADVLVIPREPGRPGVVLEFKRLRAHEAPESALGAAVAQIQGRGYAAQLVGAGAAPAFAYGVAFDGKALRVRKI